jgi:hypothetical protein
VECLLRFRPWYILSIPSLFYYLFSYGSNTRGKKPRSKHIHPKTNGSRTEFFHLSPERGNGYMIHGSFFYFYVFFFKKKFFFCEKNEIIFYRQTFVTERIFIYSSRMYFNVNLFWIFIILSRADDIVVRSTGFLVREFCVCYTGRGLFSLFSCWPSCFDCGQSIFIFVCTQRHFIEYLFVRLFN